MARCIFCGKWLLFSSKFGLCDNCRSFLVTDLKNRARIINDYSARILKTTKNPETRISRTKLLKEQLEHLLAYKRKGIDIDNMVGSDNFQNMNEYYNFVDNEYKNLLKEKDDKNTTKKLEVSAVENKNYPQIFTQIPERTKRLMWITDKNPEEFEVWPDMPFYKSGEYIEYADIKISIKISVGQTNEPSLIYTKWPISRPRDPENIEPPGYYPSYQNLNPHQRWKYLDWLCDIKKPIDIGYVFLYYYGLESHLVMGNFDEAFEEILDLLKYHHHPSFKNYSTTALIISGYNKGKYELIPRIPYDYSNINSAILLFKAINNIKLTPEEVIALSNRVDFKNKRYIKKYPERFKKILSEKMFEDEKRNGEHLLKRINWKNSPKTMTITYANTSFPDEARTPTIYDITENLDFRIEIIDLLATTHEKLKHDLAEDRKNNKKI